MAQILVDEQGKIICYAKIGTIQGGIDVELPEDIDDCISYINGSFVRRTLTKEQGILLEQELRRIDTWYKDHDYYPNKIITGEWLSTDQRWIDYLAERIVKRARYDEIMELLSGAATPPSNNP